MIILHKYIFDKNLYYFEQNFYLLFLIYNDTTSQTQIFIIE